MVCPSRNTSQVGVLKVLVAISELTCQAGRVAFFTSLGLLILLFRCFLLSLTDRLSKMSQFPHENWIGRNPAVDTLSPMDFCFPGTHDSGSYQKPNFDPIVSSEWVASSDIRFLPSFQTVAARWCESQPGCNIYTQLMSGVRFLDLRVACDVHNKNPQYFLVHTFAVSKLEDVLADIKRFVSAHPAELVVMKVLNEYGCNDMDLMKVFQDTLGAYFFPNYYGGKIMQTIGAILKRGKRILALYHTTEQLYSNLWFKSNMLLYPFPFKSMDTVAEKQKYLKEELEKYVKAIPGLPNPMMFQLSYTLTELPMDVAESIFTGGSLVELAKKMNPTLMPFVENWLSASLRGRINVITVDNENPSDIVRVCETLIAERLAHRKYGAPPPAPVSASAADGLSGRRRARRWLRKVCCAAKEEDEEADDEPFTRLLPPKPAKGNGVSFRDDEYDAW